MVLINATIASTGVIVSYIIYLLISRTYASIRNAATARKLHCEEPPFERNRWPLGIDSLLRTLAADRNHQFPTDLLKRFNDLGCHTYRYEVLGARHYRTADPRNIQHILTHKFADFDVGTTRLGSFYPLFGRGIFTTDGEEWKHSRALIRPQFTRDKLSDRNLEETHVQNMMTALSPLIGTNGWIDEIDLLPYFFNFTFDSATEFLFGESVNSQLGNLEGHSIGNSMSKLVTAFDTSQKAIATRRRFMDVYWLYDTREMREACKIVHEFADHFVRLALAKDLRKATVEKSGGNKDQYILLEALAADCKDPIRLRTELLHTLIAGRDTTASHLGWVFHSLARDPQRYQKLRGIILEDFGTYEDTHEISFAKLKDCAYLRYVNNEALRLHPVVPLNARLANKDTTLPFGGGKDGNSPIFIPKGSTCYYSVYVMHRRKDIWSPDADEFKPERWEGRKVGWEYLPFNGGPRICIGQQFALTEASYVIIRIMQRFGRIQSLDPDEVVRYKMGLSNSISQGVRVSMHSA
ncbi:cytochrome P450 [Periconia macrospinosa]|uniref:Cytochrome P450 n=1 Tax=Periconia macrospinosa TaxID=97972 RepID=A0A2V1D2J6_9PLEO|nr:cytochrome P450 [Periconia macrospinosa]